jgi:phosphate transport system permease protein
MEQNIVVAKRSIFSFFSYKKNVGKLAFYEKMFTRTTMLAAIFIVVMMIAVFLTLVVGSMPSIRALGFKFLSSSEWDPVTNKFGAVPFLFGTLITSVLALLISTPFSLAFGLLLGEYYPKGIFSNIFKNIIELLAGIPSVIYGFWGLFVLVPIVRSWEIKFGIMPYGVGIFTSSFILSLMVMPYSASLITQVVSMTPSNLKEAAYSLGATRYEVIKKLIIPYTRSGIFAGMLLALGRALGETMAVTMLIGNVPQIPKSLFGPGYTMASIIANEFTEATDKVYLSALVEIGALLFIVTFIINIIGKQVIRRFAD